MISIKQNITKPLTKRRQLTLKVAEEPPPSPKYFSDKKKLKVTFLLNLFIATFYCSIPFKNLYKYHKLAFEN